MLRNEKPYEFRSRMDNVHPAGIRNYDVKLEDDEIEIKDGAVIVIPEDASVVTVTAVKDFLDYLFVSMNVSARIVRGLENKGDIYVGTKDDLGIDLGEANGYKGCKIVVKDAVYVCGNEDRGIAAALYFIEDQMSIRKAPYIKREGAMFKPDFSPRMVHSGYGLDDFPDQHLSAIAHSGRDAIIVFVKEPDIAANNKKVDFVNLVERAARYGLDVYAYSLIHLLTHPEAEDAEKIYDEVYGSIFKCCPGLKGIVLVGESVEFASDDEHVEKEGIGAADEDASVLPVGKPRPGWWPCFDYPLWINRVKNSVRKYNPDADIVFWTYNWGWAPKEDRLKLINSMPADVSLLVTYEMFEKRKKDGITINTSDYTISFEGPGQYFTSEAEAAKKRGLRLYSMVNTGGMTWDFGVIPYVPVAQQWMKRYKTMKECVEKYNLCGVMENHHYGYYPSFIGDFSGRVFNSDISMEKMEKVLDEVLIKHFDNAEDVKKALSYFSEMITYLSAANEDQYGPMRIGPAYPLNLKRISNVPYDNTSHYGGKIHFPDYTKIPPQDRVMHTAMSVRMPKEVEWLKEAARLMNEGVDILESIEKKNENLERLINLGKYICCCLVSVRNVKRWYLTKTKLSLEQDREKAKELIAKLKEIIADERCNVKKAIPLTEADSRLGWEPSMEYIGHTPNLYWKLRQLDYVETVELVNLTNEYDR